MGESLEFRILRLTFRRKIIIASIELFSDLLKTIDHLNIFVGIAQVLRFLSLSSGF